MSSPMRRFFFSSLAALALCGLWIVASPGARAEEPVAPVVGEAPEAPAEVGVRAADEPVELIPESAPDVAASADDEDEDLKGIEEITVTTNRREESVQDVAVSVTALSGEFLQDAGLNDFASLQKFTPNVSILPQTDSRSTAIRIRGIGSVGSNAGIDPSVGVFIDGVYQGRAGMSIADLLDIERIEVLRGPQGTLYGKNTAAGAINVYSKKPTYDFSGDFEAVIGNYGDYEGRWAINAPLIEEALATRFSGYYVQREGYDINAFDGSDVNDTQKWGIRSRTLWEVTDSFELTLSGDYAQQDDTCCVSDIVRYGSPLPGGLSEILPSAREIETFQLNPPPPYNQPQYDPPFIDQPLPVEDPEDRLVSADVSPRNQLGVGGVSLEGIYDWNDYLISSLTAYRNYQSDSAFDGDFSLLDSTEWDTDVSLNQASTELRLVSPASELFDYVAGLYFFWMEMETTDRLSWTPEYIASTNFEPLNPNFQPQYNDGANDHSTLNVAGYGEANLGVGEYFKWPQQVVLTGGLRVGWERKTRVGRQTSFGPLCSFSNADTPANPGGLMCLADPSFPQTPLSGPPQFFDQERSVTDLTGRAILKYWPIEDVMMYASFASGIKSGGFNQLRTNDASDRPGNAEFGDEHSKSYEGGVKTSWLQRMITFNLTGFYTDYDNFQAQVFDGLGIRVINAGEFVSYGFESELTLAPIPQWITSLGIGFNKTEYKSFDRGPCTGEANRIKTASPATQVPNCALLPGTGFVQDLAGRPRDNAPEWTISLFSRFEDGLPWFDVNWYVQTDYQYIDERFLNTALDPVLNAHAVNMLGFRVGLKHPESRWEVAAWISNTLDEAFFVAGFDVPTMGGQAVVLGPPRTFGGTFRFSF